MQNQQKGELMEIVDWIIRVGALAGAIAAVVALAKKVIAPIKGMSTDIANISARTETIEKHDKEQYLGILRLTIMSEGMPISERLIAGEKYIKAGGNGAVKHYYQELVKNHTK
nr:MAG TPA: hypothetical protein [Caudoviricetes sp.]